MWICNCRSSGMKVSPTVRGGEYLEIGISRAGQPKGSGDQKDILTKSLC